MKKRLLSMALCLCMTLTTVMPAHAIEGDYTDMPKEGHWSYSALKNAVGNGLIEGYDGALHPTAAVSRAQLAAILNRAFGAIDTADISGFADVSPEMWFYTDMAKALQMGTFEGRSATTLRPLDTATRQETFCVLARALKLEDGAVSALDAFNDRGEIAAWAVGPLAALVEQGYVRGNGGRLNPKSSITRAELAQLMDNIIDSYIRQAGEYSLNTDGTVMINCAGVVLKNSVIKGNLIIGEGVGNGEVTLDNVTVTGRLLVRGGGEHSIKLINKTNVGTVIVSKSGNGGVRVVSDASAKVEVLFIADSKDDVIIEGTFAQIVVSAPMSVIFNNATVAEVTVEVPSAELKVEGTSKIESAKVAEAAVGAKISVAKEATVQKLDSAAPNVAIGGEGKVVQATVSGAGTQVNTKGTELTVAKGTEDVQANGKAVAPTGTPVKPDPAPVTSYDSDDGGGSSNPTEPTNPTAVTSQTEFLAALENTDVTSIEVAANFILTSEDYFTVDKPVVVRPEACLTILGFVGFHSTLTNDGTVSVAPNSELYLGENDDMRFVNRGSLIISDAGVDGGSDGGAVYLYPNATLEGSGTVQNDGTIFYYYSLGALDSGDCAEFQTTTGSGHIVREAAVYTQATLQDAMERTANGEQFFTDIELKFDDSIQDFDGSFVMPVSNYSLSAGHCITITEGATFTIPSGSTLTIEANAELHIEGTLVVAGSCINKGQCIGTVSATVDGVINTIEGGKSKIWHPVTTETQLQGAVENNDSLILVDDDIEVTQSIDIESEVTVAAGKTLTVAEGKTLTLKMPVTVASGAALVNEGTLNVWNQLIVEYDAALVNEGTIIIDNKSNLYVENDGYDSDHHGMLNNANGIIDLRSGWLDYRDFNGEATPWFTPNPKEAVRTYSNLADVAREIYYMQHDNNNNTDLLIAAEDADITTYKDKYKDWSELQNEFNDDTDGVNAIAMLLKNGILIPGSEDHLYPYETVTKIQVIELLYNSAKTLIDQNGFTDIDTGSDIFFSDISTLPETQKTAISYLAKAGILEAGEEENLNPDSLVSSVCYERINSVYVEATKLYTACSKLMDKLREQDIVVTNLEQLKTTVNSSTPNKIVIDGNITLDENMTITRDVEINFGAALRTGAYSLTIGYETGEDEFSGDMYVSEYGRLIVKGTLEVPGESTLCNLTEIRLEGGNLTVGGTYVDSDGNMIDGSEQKGMLEGTDGAALTNAGAFTNSGTVRLTACTFTNTGDYTNNGNLEVAGGTIEATAGNFKNAGRFRIEDVYGSDTQKCSFAFGDTITSDSEWIEYVGVATTEGGLREALAYHKTRYNENKNYLNPFGLNYYDRIDINDDITVNGDLDVQDVNLYVNRIEEWVEGEDAPLVTSCKLTNKGCINLKNSSLYVYGRVLNNGTINVGVVPVEGSEATVEQNGNVFVMPLGEFENKNTLNLNKGEFIRYDELNVGDPDYNFGKNIGMTSGVGGDIMKQVAIVHDVLGLRQAAAKDGQDNYTEQEYDRIEVKRGEAADADIELDGDLTIDADLYNEWGCGINVPAGRTLNFTGCNHHIDNQGDLLVYGALNLDASYLFVNNGRIHVGDSQNAATAIFVNAGTIENSNLIEVAARGTFDNIGIVRDTGTINVDADGAFTGNAAK